MSDLVERAIDRIEVGISNVEAGKTHLGLSTIDLQNLARLTLAAWPHIKAEIARLKGERDEALSFISREGYRRCDTAACNCNSWHGGNARRRLMEIRDFLDGEYFPETNGVATLDFIKKVCGERNAAIRSMKDPAHD